MTATVSRRFGRIQLNITLVIALGIGLFGLIRYFTSTQTNPVTGEAQRVGSITPQQEIALGLQSAPSMVSQMGGEVPLSDPRSQFVRAIGQKLVASIEKPHPWKFNFHLLADRQTVNAFALPGGQVFITVALLEQLQDEAQLAGVLGHEIGHVINRHSAEHMAQSQLGQQLVTAFAIGSSQQDNGYLATQVAAFANQMIQLKYGRDDELESDAFGATIMARAGYDPREMIGVMEILKRTSGGGSRPTFTSTHPDPGNRAERIDAVVRQLYPQGVPANLTKGLPLAQGVPSGTFSLPGTTKKPKW